MLIKENYLLKGLTTMRVGGPASFFIEVKSVEEIKESVEWAKEKGLEIFVLSGGSNVVVSDRGFDGLVVYVNIQGFEKVKENKNNVWVRIGAGEIWDGVVERAVENNWHGIENLSLIPGKIGGLVAQNAGAYGQEIKNTVEYVKVFELKSGKIKELNTKECKFGYRQSIFNTTSKGRYIIIEAVLKLARRDKGQINYPDMQKYFENKGIKNPSLKEIRQVIIHIRDSKLPNVDKVGSAGSFFKNLVLNNKEFDKLLIKLKENFSEEYVQKALELKDKFKIETGIKMPTAWLVEICGLKGSQVGGAKIYEKQPLVIINEKGEATADDVMNLFKKVRQEVYNKTGMELEPEPRLVGFTDEELKEYFGLK